MKTRMFIRSLWNKLWYKIIYVIVVGIYIARLNVFNNELRIRHFDSAFSLLAYKEYASIKYFVVALILFLWGIILIYMEMQHIKCDEKLYEDIVISFFSIIVIVGLLIAIIVFISNPILRAILIAVSTVVGVVYVAAN